MCQARAAGALVVLVAVQLSVLGLYLPPVFKYVNRRCHLRPRRSFHCRSTLPCEISAGRRVGGASGVQLSVLGLYLPPVFKSVVDRHYSAPDDHFAAGPDCRVTEPGAGALVVLVAVQLSVLGLYLPPVLKRLLPSHPPQTIISLPVQTAV